MDNEMTPDNPVQSVNSHVRCVSVKQVVIVVSTIGKGVDGDPIRPFRQFFDMDGNEIDAGDYTQ